ncbi:hypothetical protein [Aeromicrobium endophyticum]|uniref:Uncharacterized protein n=1 Tax=Aeromicrobium endophyticum TaxID=2292704 RepID=A0A371P131_9ACTN|nr:hypothetical protein [Aeromicrobium endophyticum]REK69664.1 hypothetical protein DX116_10690 [Aeromicrobium endophyticum]
MTELVVRPDRSALHAARPWIAAGTAVTAVVLVVATCTGHVVVAVFAAPVLLAGILLLVVLMTVPRSVVVGAGIVRLTRWNGRSLTLPVDDDLQGLHARYVSNLGGVSSPPRLVMRRPGVRGRITLAEGVWTSADVKRVADAVGVEPAPGAMDRRDWQRLAPGLLPWVVRWPYTAIMLGVAVTLVVAAGLITLLD